MEATALSAVHARGVEVSEALPGRLVGEVDVVAEVVGLGWVVADTGGVVVVVVVVRLAA